MSILIEGMEMPKNCCPCPVNMEVCKRGYEYLLKHPELYDKRADDCPLIPIPAHGRLIDADALMARFEKDEIACDEHGRDFSFSFKSSSENCTEWWYVQQILMDAETVIQAEGGEE